MNGKRHFVVGMTLIIHGKTYSSHQRNTVFLNVDTVTIQCKKMCNTETFTTALVQYTEHKNKIFNIKFKQFYDIL